MAIIIIIRSACACAIPRSTYIALNTYLTFNFNKPDSLSYSYLGQHTYQLNKSNPGLALVSGPQPTFCKLFTIDYVMNLFAKFCVGKKNRLLIGLVKLCP